MRKGTLILYEKETDYAIRFMNYFNELPNFIFEVRTFTNLQALNEHLNTHEGDVLLISSGIFLEEWQREKVRKVILLTENLEEKNGESQAIYKYQSMDNVKQQLIQLWDETGVKKEEKNAKQRIKYIAVCSPFGGSGKTMFSLAYGQASAKRKRTLYIGLEAVKSFSKSERGGGSFSELLYFLKEKTTDFDFQKLVTHIGELDCIHSPDYYGDWYRVEESDLDYMMEQLESQTRYETVLFDLGIWNFASIYLLSKMDKIYIPEWRATSVFRKEIYLRENWKLDGYGDLELRKQSIKLPYDEEVNKGDFRIERMLKTKMGQWVWNVIESEWMSEKNC